MVGVDPGLMGPEMVDPGDGGGGGYAGSLAAVSTGRIGGRTVSTSSTRTAAPPPPAPRPPCGLFDLSCHATNLLEGIRTTVSAVVEAVRDPAPGSFIDYATQVVRSAVDRVVGRVVDTAMRFDSAVHALRGLPWPTPMALPPEPAFDQVPRTDNVAYAPVENARVSIQDEADEHAFSPSDVDQGGLGDCGSMSSFAALAQANPALLDSAIHDNEDGTYTVRLFVNGEVHYVTVTAEVPMRNGVPVFAGIGDTASDGSQEIWPLVLEKAYAQLYGSYNGIQTSWQGSVMTALTGEPSTTHMANQLAFDELATWIEQDQAVTIQSLYDFQVGDNELYQNGDLIARHAYYIVGVDRDNGTVIVQNPWGWSEEPLELTYEQLQSSFDFVTTNPAGHGSDTSP